MPKKRKQVARKKGLFKQPGTKRNAPAAGRKFKRTKRGLTK